MPDARRARRGPRGPRTLRARRRLTAAAAALAVAVAAAAALVGAGADFTASCPPPCECKWQSGNKAAACGGAGLEAVPQRLSDDIQNLELSDNPLGRLPPDAFRRAGLRNLKKLALRSCRLDSVHRTAFAGLRIMIELDLSRNRLRELDADTFRETERLRRVNLAGNLLASLDDGLFRDLQYLQRVDASDNRIARVAAGALAGLPRLDALRLDGNELTRLRPDALRDLARLASLDLHGNRWRCDCDLRAFRDWVLERNLYTAPTACAAPPALVGRLWSDLASANFACAPTVLEPPPDAILRARDDNVTLACKAVGDPAPDVVWTFNSRPIEASERRYAIAESSVGLVRWANVTIVQVRAGDRGGYACVAENAGGRDERNVTLSVARAGGGGGGGAMSAEAVAVALGCAGAALLAGVAALVAWCCAARGRDGGGGGKRLLKAEASGRIASGDGPAAAAEAAAHPAGCEPDKREANPVAKPPRRYDAPLPPSSPVDRSGAATELFELNRTLLGMDYFRASTESGLRSARSPPPPPPPRAPHEPPDLLTFPPRLTGPAAGSTAPGTARFRSPLAPPPPSPPPPAPASPRASLTSPDLRRLLALQAPRAWSLPPAPAPAPAPCAPLHPLPDAARERATQV